ncbi:MAG: recombination protein NinG [Alphaproteobacteria bacterium]|nr:MAG: recombination protein NinG [Alphaproteobacteria bacterium]
MLKPAISMKIKLKTCRECGVKFTPFKPLQSVCSPLCAINKVNKNKLKIQKEAYKIEKERIKTRSDWIKEVQTIFNKYIRLRDKEYECISCDKPATWDGQWHASHFYATSIRPNLRFNENNVHKACSVCNNYMHGNLTPYREKLILKIGIEEMNILDNAKTPAKYTIQDLKELKAHYAKITKELTGKMQD